MRVSHRPSVTISQVPPFACSFVLSVISSYLSDKYKQRGLTAVLISLIAIPGYSLFLRQSSFESFCYHIVVLMLWNNPAGTSDKHADYAALFLQIMGTYPVAPCMGTWMANNLQPHYRRATGVALAFASTNLGGTVTSWQWIMPRQYAEYYYVPDV